MEAGSWHLDGAVTGVVLGKGEDVPERRPSRPDRPRCVDEGEHVETETALLAPVKRISMVLSLAGGYSFFCCFVGEIIFVDRLLQCFFSCPILLCSRNLHCSRLKDGVTMIVIVLGNTLEISGFQWIKEEKSGGCLQRRPCTFFSFFLLVKHGLTLLNPGFNHGLGLWALHSSLLLCQV